MRTAIYARFSTDKQSADSTGDQVARCREFAERRGWTVVDELAFEDAGISGASRHNRPKLLELVARIDEWDVLVCFDFTRLARDSEDLGWIRNRLRVHKRTAYAVDTGLEIFNVGAKVLGVLGEEYLSKLRADTHRGLRGRVERGFSGGGLPFGYRSVPVYTSGRTDSRGAPEPDGYRWEIDPARAAVVRRIFDLYLGGAGFGAIARKLNREGVASPRPRASKGSGWCPDAIRSITMNPTYRGEAVWNRSEWIKDHETGKRMRHDRPASEWLARAVPAIVDATTWERAQTAREARTKRVRFDAGAKLAGTARGLTRAHGRHLLSGFLACGACGGSFHALYRTCWGCGWRDKRGPTVCANGVRVPMAELDDLVLGAFVEQVLGDAVVDAIVERAVAVVRGRLAGRGGAADLADVDARIAKLVRVAETAGDVDELGTRLAALRAERDALRARLGAGAPALDERRLRARARARVADLRGGLSASPEGARRVLYALLGEGKLRVSPDAERGYRVEGTALLDLDTTAPGSANGTGRREWSVAGAGFEPATFGL